MMTDCEYRAFLSDIAKGNIPIEDIGKIRAEVEVRLSTLNLPVWLPPPLAFSRRFPLDWYSYQDYLASIKKKAPEASRKLKEVADELNVMRFSTLFSPPDDIAWPMLNNERVALADFLGKAAKLVEASSKDFCYCNIDNPSGRKLAFDSFWIRDIQRIVNLHHKKEIKEKTSFKPESGVSNDWAGMIRKNAEPSTHKADNYRINVIIASICTSLLAEEITNNDVAKQ